MKGVFHFKGKSSDEMGLYMNYGQTFTLPERATETVEVIGLDEKVIFDLDYYKNVEIVFPVKLVPRPGQSVKEQIHEIGNWLYTTTYEKLTTPDDQDFYRLATFTNSSSFAEQLEVFGEGELVFDAKPYRYSRLGDKAIVILEKGKQIINTMRKSQPIVKIWGTGDVDLYINSQRMNFFSLSDYIEIDCFMLTAIDQAGGNLSFKVSETSFPWFVLEEGANRVTWTGSVSKIEIIPRWRSL